MACAKMLVLGVTAALLGGPTWAQTVEPAAPRYLEPVYLRKGPNPYLKWNAASVAMEGSTITVRIQGIRCEDLCSPSPIAEVELGCFPTGTYKLVVVFNGTDITSQQFSVAPPTDPFVLVDYTGMWWAPSEPGWGITIAQGPTRQVFAVWFVYDEAGRPTWYTLQGTIGGNPGVSGPIYRTTGPFFGDAFDPARVAYDTAGSGSIVFYSSFLAVFNYVADGVRGTKYLARQSIE